MKNLFHPTAFVSWKLSLSFVFQKEVKEKEKFERRILEASKSFIRARFVDSDRYSGRHFCFMPFELSNLCAETAKIFGVAITLQCVLLNLLEGLDPGSLVLLVKRVVWE